MNITKKQFIRNIKRIANHRKMIGNSIAPDVEVELPPIPKLPKSLEKDLKRDIIDE